jgi:hypothetical protein
MLDTLSASLPHRQDNFWVFDEREIKYAEESAPVMTALVEIIVCKINKCGVA